ncbi:alpha/beta-hydrolase [Laetiporus sulphureus 93-53]|uniref:Alpha/beta-hydrolase n=1 Tax=Laetiporus sulphureus 93-53 TaxID=1314785 RepID=A0A165DIQ8_9APHY|nr:alpha/beta-hydrolase [Laetiporus sulphureus 93-53]KZT04972.1 alpha/beta-hydrolase [Laetiporus sulphureus 93-53]
MAPSPIVKIVRSSDGNPIYAEAIGDPSKPSMVLVHGFNLSAAALDRLFFDKRLLEDVYMVRFDMRGHGRSGKPVKPEGYISSLFADDYATVVRAFNLKTPIYVGWSYGCTVATDICAKLGPKPFAGLVFMTALPYLGPMLYQVGKPEVLSLLPPITVNDDTTQYNSMKVAFMDTMFTRPEEVDFNLKAALIGQAVLQPPEVTKLILTRTQDPSGLFEAGRQGMPMLILSGGADKQVNNHVVINGMSPYFNNLDLYTIENGGHMPFYEHKDEVVDALLKFVRRVLISA